MPRPSPPWVLVSAGFHEQGGQSKANAALADHLLDRGSPVHLVGHDVDPRFVGRPGCTIHRVPRPLNADLLGVFALRSRGRSAIRRVVAEHPSARVVVNGGCCSWPGINWVHYVHHGWTRLSPGASFRARLKERLAGWLFRRQERRALRLARLVFTNSERTRELVCGRVGVEPARARVVYLGGESSWLPPSGAERRAARAWLGQPDGRPLAVFVGGFGHDERKGFDTLWQAWRSLCDDPAWDVDLVAAGGGAGEPGWRRRIADANLSPRVRMIGFTDRVFEVLAAADLLVSPVRYEPYGLNVQEAVCRGVPSLVSAAAGVVEQYPADLGELVLPDPDDWRDLAARLRRWRADVAGWRKRFVPFSERLRRRSWADMAAEIVRLAESNPEP